MRSRASSWALLAAVTFFSVAARAEVDIKHAREHFFKAERLYQIERFQDAFTEYQEAFLAKPDPNVLFNMAQCQRLMGNGPEAIRFYRRFLAERPNPPNLAMVQQHIRDLEAAERVATAPPPVAAPLLPSLSPSPLPSQSSMRKGFAVAPGPSAKPAVSPAPAPIPAVAFNQPAGAASLPGIRPALAFGSTAPPPLAAPALPPQSLALAHDIGSTKTSMVRADGRPGSQNDAGDRPIYKKWWFWTAVGVVLAGAVVIGAVAGHKSDPSCAGLTACQ